MGLSSGSSNPAEVKSEINVTPLVDVMLVLLIIFMVVTPMLQKGKAVQLPLTAAPQPLPEDKSQTLVVITREGTLEIEKEPVSDADFQAKLQENFERNPNNSVVIKADSQLTYGDVKKRMLQVRAANFINVGLITSKRDGTTLPK
ncbi:MAG: biopolymer transporter ExbD [Acidobacteriota bacterium]